MMFGLHFAALLQLASTAEGLRIAPLSIKTNARTVPALMSNKSNTTSRNISQVPSGEKEALVNNKTNSSSIPVLMSNKADTSRKNISQVPFAEKEALVNNKTNASSIPALMINTSNTTSKNRSQVPSEGKKLMALHNGTEAILKIKALSTDKSGGVGATKFADGAISADLSHGDSQVLSSTTTMMGSTEKAIKQIAQSLIKNLDTQLSGGAGKMPNVTESATVQKRMEDEHYVHERVQEWLHNTSQPATAGISRSFLSRTALVSNKTNASSIPALMSNKTNTTSKNRSQVPCEEKELIALHNGMEAITSTTMPVSHWRVSSHS